MLALYDPQVRQSFDPPFLTLFNVQLQVIQGLLNLLVFILEYTIVLLTIIPE